jgi:tetratricopeptide (TPR) repeat protein
MSPIAIAAIAFISIVVIFILYKKYQTVNPVAMSDLDYYQIGENYHAIGDADKAATYYQRAIDSRQPENTDFLITRIRTRVTARPEIDEPTIELPVWIPTPIPILVQMYAPTIMWHEDRQNVHDSALTNSIETQYQKLKQMNQGSPQISIDEIIADVERLPDADKAVRLLRHLQFHGAYPVTKLANDTELMLIIEVYKQMRKDNLVAFATALADCYENDVLVCISGRVARIFASMAHIIPGMGVLKTREIIRNEIFTECAKIVERAGSSNPVVEIDTMIDTYADLSAADRAQIKLECRAGIL